MRALLDGADAAGRNLSEAERREYDALELELRRGSFDPRHAGSPFGGTTEPGQPDVLGPEQRMTDWVRERNARRDTAALDDVDGEQFSLGRVMTALVNRDRRHLNEFEKRALVEGVDASGGYLLPQILSAEVVDRLRPFTRVFQAGARMVPMETETLLFARLSGGVTPAWKAEGAPIADQSMTFDRITLKALTLPLLVKISQELFDDLSPEAAQIIEGEMLKALALELDRVVLRGTGAGEPLGILNQPGVTLQPLKTGNSSTNGGSLSGYDDVALAISSIRRHNLEPNAFICSARVAGDWDRMKDAIGQPLRRPPSVDGIWPPLVSNIVPDNITVGNATTCSEFYVGQWDQCLVGMRTDIRVGIRALDQRFADTLQIGLLCYIRGDVAVRHGEAFTIVTGVLPFTGD